MTGETIHCLEHWILLVVARNYEELHKYTDHAFRGETNATKITKCSLRYFRLGFLVGEEEPCQKHMPKRPRRTVGHRLSVISTLVTMGFEKIETWRGTGSSHWNWGNWNMERYRFQWHSKPNRQRAKSRHHASYPLNCQKCHGSKKDLYYVW